MILSLNTWKNTKKKMTREQEFNIPFWMYGVIIDALDFQLKELLKSKINQAIWSTNMKNNRWDRLGQINLTCHKIKKLQTKHSDAIKECLVKA